MKQDQSVTPCDPLVTPSAMVGGHTYSLAFQWLTYPVTPVTPETLEKTLGQHGLGYAVDGMGQSAPRYAVGRNIGIQGSQGSQGSQVDCDQSSADGPEPISVADPSKGHPAAGITDPEKRRFAKIFNHVSP